MIDLNQMLEHSLSWHWRLAAAATLALAVHISIFATLADQLAHQQPRPPSRLPDQRPKTAALRLVTRSAGSKVNKDALAPSPPRSPSSPISSPPLPQRQTTPVRPHPPSAEAKIKVSSQTAPHAPFNHGQWLPDSSWEKAGQDIGHADATSWRAPPALVKVTQPFAGRLDIPLGFRLDRDAAKAVAKLRRLANGRLLLDYVEGEPLMRAVLYEALRSAENRASLLAMFDSLGSELHLSLRLNSVKIDAPPTREEERLLFSGHRIVIERTMFIYSGRASGPGIALPDEEAERAKRRDNVHRQRLLLSPAYLSPLRERELP